MAPAKLFLCFAALSLLAYAPMLGGWFQEDDYDILFHVARGGPFGMWSVAPTYFFRPIISLTFWTQYHLGGLNPVPYRVFNDLVHAGVATILALLVLELLTPFSRQGEVEDQASPPIKGTKGIVIAVGLIFLVHPSHAEAVNWIAARTDLLSAFFGLFSLWTFACYLRTGHRAMMAASLASFGIGLLCKESVLLIPLIAAVYAWTHRTQRARAPLAGLSIVTVAYFALRIVLIGSGMKGNLERAHGLKLIAATVTEAIRALLPGLPFGDPNLNNVEALKTPAGIAYMALGIASLVLLVVLAIRSRSSRPTVIFLILATLLALAPAAGLSVRLFRSQGERFVYLPSAFLLAAIVVLLTKSGTAVLPVDRTARHRKEAVAQLTLCFVLVTGLSLLQWQNIIWRGGAELSQRVQWSFVRDVVDGVPVETRRVALLDVPVSVQGGYAVGYVFPSVAALFRPGRDLDVDVVSALLLRSPHHQVQIDRQGDWIDLKSADAGARFSLEATGTGRKLNPENLSASGYRIFGPTGIQFDLRSLPAGTPVFFWDGNKFCRLAI